MNKIEDSRKTVTKEVENKLRVSLYKQLKIDSLKDHQNFLQIEDSKISSKINIYRNVINSSKSNNRLQGQVDLTKDLQEKNYLIESIKK